MADRIDHRFSDPESMSRFAAGLVLKAAAEAVAAVGRFSLALAGGTTPRRLYQILAEQPWTSRIDWPKTHLFWGDERAVPESDPYSNYGLVRENLLSRIDIPPENIHRPDMTKPLDRAAADYEKDLQWHFRTKKPSLDLILLGLGPDGHTASLFPGRPELAETTALVVAAPEPIGRPAVPRLTFTLPLINRARRVILMAAGGSKGPVMERLLHDPAGSTDLPAGRLNPGKELIRLFTP